MEIKAETMQKSKFKRICVFCGSSQGKKSSYQDAAVDLGNELVIHEFQLIGRFWDKKICFFGFIVSCKTFSGFDKTCSQDVC